MKGDEEPIYSALIFAYRGVVGFGVAVSTMCKYFGGMG